MQTDDKVLAFTQSRMSPEARKDFEVEMANDPDLRAQVAAMSALRGAFAENDGDRPSSDWGDLSDRITKDGQAAVNDNRPFRFSILQVACIAIASVLGWQLVETAMPSTEPTGFQTASTADIGPALQVIFAPDVTQSDVTTLLTDLNGRIVDGPSALGLYLVTFMDEADRDAAFSVLTDRADIAEEVMNN